MTCCGMSHTTTKSLVFHRAPGLIPWDPRRLLRAAGTQDACPPSVLPPPCPRELAVPGQEEIRVTLQIMFFLLKPSGLGDGGGCWYLPWIPLCSGSFHPKPHISLPCQARGWKWEKSQNGSKGVDARAVSSSDPAKFRARGHRRALSTSHGAEGGCFWGRGEKQRAPRGSCWERGAKKRPANMGANTGHCGNWGQGLQTACGCEGGAGWELCGRRAKRGEVPLYAAVLSPGPGPGPAPVPCPPWCCSEQGPWGRARSQVPALGGGGGQLARSWSRMRISNSR